MDSTDKKILNLLQRNARITNKELAKEMGLSTTPVFERVKRLERQGVIKNYVAMVDAKKVERNLFAFLQVKLDKHTKGQLVQFENAMARLSEVMECYHMAGSTDFILKVVVADMGGFQRFMTEKIAAVENILSIETSFVLNEAKHETAYQLN